MSKSQLKRFAIQTLAQSVEHMRIKQEQGMTERDEALMEDSESPANRLPDEVLNCIARNLGWDPDDDSDDFTKYAVKINRMTPEEQFSRYCEWNGLIGWSGTLRRAVFAIYQVDET